MLWRSLLFFSLMKEKLFWKEITLKKKLFRRIRCDMDESLGRDLWASNHSPKSPPPPQVQIRIVWCKFFSYTNFQMEMYTPKSFESGKYLSWYVFSASPTPNQNCLMGVFSDANFQIKTYTPKSFQIKMYTLKSFESGKYLSWYVSSASHK